MIEYNNIGQKYKDKDIIFYGASKQGKLMLKKLNMIGAKPIYFCDNNPKLWNSKLEGINIISVDELEKIYDKKGEKLLIIITSMYVEEIMDILAVRKIQSEIQTYSYVKLLIDSNADTEDIRNIKQLKDMHKGERCFIVGNGPSLKYDDLELLKDEYTFAANKIFLSFKNTSWRPTYYGCMDRMVIENLNDKLKDVSCEKLLTILEAKESIRFNLDKTLFFNFRFLSDFDNTPMFSEDISKILFEGFSITYCFLQIAVYMGFKEIYLLGVDHNYSVNSDNSKDYFSSEYVEKNEKRNPSRLEETTIAYEKANEYAKGHNIKIFNATRGGKLEVFKRINLEYIVK